MDVGDLPTGTITFLFTDIEGSTRRWQEGSGMSEELARHDGIIRDVVSANAGHLLKHTGDGVIAVFDTAPSAVGAAVDAQRRLAEEDWGPKPLRVRMAVHSGHAERRDNDYFGTSVNVTARLMSAGHGGQILVSQTAEELIGSQLPGDVDLVDLGEHRLADLDHGLRLYQVSGPGLDDHFPPVVTASIPTNLPQPRTRFIGRGDDVIAIADQFPHRRLVTLIGVGGAGKTRLAIAVGRHLIRERVDAVGGGVFFADLSSVTDGAAVPRTVAGAMAMPPIASPGSPLESDTVVAEVAAFLRNRRALLIIDNCEHLLDDVADLVDLLLEEAPGLSVLATSREGISLEGEQLVQVRSLSLPTDHNGDGSEAMELLVDRIRAVQPDFEPTPTDQDALTEICLRLDGIPLALELAAARVAHLSTREVADRLGDRFSLLTGGRRRSQRQQTLQATLDWSYQLLSPTEQDVLRRLSVFSGGFTLKGSEAVASGVDGSAVALLGSLVDKSLVVAETLDDETRYRLLETIRLYAEAKLTDAGDAEMARSLHRDWFLAWMETQPYDRCFLSEDVGRMFNREYRNLWAAMEWCYAQDRIDLLRRMLTRSASLIWVHSRYDQAERWYAPTLAYERSLPRGQWFVHVIVEWITAWRFGGDPGEAEEAMRRVEDHIAELEADSPALIMAHMTLLIYLAVFPQRAVEWAERSERLAQLAAESYPLVRAWALWAQAVAHLYDRRNDEAEVLLSGLESAEWLPSDVSYIASTVALIRHFSGRHEEALRLLERSQWSYDTWLLFEEATAAASHAALGDLQQGRDRMRRSIDSVRESGWELPLARSDCLVGLAALAALEGEPEQASRLIAAVPLMAAGTPAMWVLLRHYRDVVRDQLDVDTRRRLIEEGRGLSVDEAIDAELARWEG